MILGQFSLFDFIDQGQKFEPAIAVNKWSGTETKAMEPTPLAKKLFPACKYIVMVGEYVCALCESQLAWDKIPEGHAFYHFMVNGKVYSGAFIGSAGKEDEEQ